jgi:hypothetical protein
MHRIATGVAWARMPHAMSAAAPARAGRRLRALGVAAGLIVAGSLTTASSALAAGQSVYADGLHISTGALVDPDHRVWISDHNAGFCRVTDPTAAEPGHIENPQFPGDTAHGAPTCLGGLLPEAGTGPDAASGAVLYTKATGERFAFIADGAAPSVDVVRAKWNVSTRKFDFDGTVGMTADPANPDRSRPNSVSLGPDGMVYVGFQKSGTIQRFDPAETEPTAEVVGRTSDGRGTTAVAAGRDESGAPTVYVSEAAGLRELHPDLDAPTTTPSFGIGLDTVGALAYDLTGDVLYVGTANGVDQADLGADKLHRFGTRPEGAAELGYATGFSMVGGLGVRPDGNVFVLDDQALLDPAEPIGTGLMYLVGLPVAHIVSGPTNAAGAQALHRAFTNDTTPTFSVTGDAGLRCSLVPSGDEPVWQDCAQGTFTPAAALEQGTYVFSTRAENAAGTGLPDGRTFTVDTTPPAQPVIVSPASGSTVGGSPQFQFAGEPFAAFGCDLGGTGAFADCAPGRTFVFASDGARTLRIRATDRAGNVSAPSDPSTFTVDVTAPTVTIAAPEEDALTGTSPAFTFAASEGGATYRCRLDDEPFAACASPAGFPAVAAGTHTFQVRATDAVGNVGPVATRSFRVGAAAGVTTDPAGTPARLDPPASPGPAAPAAGGFAPRTSAPGPISGAGVQGLGTRDPQRLARQGTIRHAFAFPAAGRVTVTWTVTGSAARRLGVRTSAKTLVIATGSLTRGSAGRGVVPLRLTAAGKRLLSRASRVRVTLTVGFKANGRPARTTRSAFTLKRR